MPVFKVKFECLNCGNVWWQEFERGDRIVETLIGVRLHSHKCTRDVTCPYCKCIECPVCGVREDVVVRERKPKDVVAGEGVMKVTFREYSNSVTMIVDGKIFRHLTVGDILPDGRTVESKEQAKAVLLEWFEKGITPIYDGSKRWIVKEEG